MPPFPSGICNFLFFAPRYRTYEVLKEETANPRVRWAYLPYSMHMAGPREVSFVECFLEKCIVDRQDDALA